MRKTTKDNVVPIDENSKIEISDNNYILLYKAPKGWKVGGYFPTIESLLNDWVVNAPAHSGKALNSLKEVVDIIQKAEKHIEKLIHGK